MSVNEEKYYSCGMYISDVNQRGNVLKLPYLYLRCKSTRKSVKVAMCIYDISINAEKC